MPDLKDRLQATLGSNYTLERELGGGGMSRVFVAEELTLERKVKTRLKGSIGPKPTKRTKPAKRRTWWRA